MSALPPLEEPRPPYTQIADALAAKIESGEWATGHVLPTGPELARHWNVSGGTITRAMRILRERGLISTHGRHGSIVTAVRSEPGHYRTARDRYALLSSTGALLAANESSIIVSSGIQDVAQDVARGLRTDQQRAIARRRITSRDGRVVERSVSWFPIEIADQCPALLTLEKIPRGTLAYVVDQTGVATRGSTERIYAREATAEETDDLGLPTEASPVLICEHTVYGRDSVLTFEIGTSPARVSILYSSDGPGLTPTSDPALMP